MARRGEDQTRSHLPVAIGLLLGWVVVIAVGAGTAADASTVLGIQGLDVVFVAIIGLLYLASIVLFIMNNPFDEEFTPPPRRRQAIWFWMLIGLGLMLWQPQFIGDFLDNLPADEDGPELIIPELAEEDVVVEPSAEPVAQLTDLLLLVGALAVAAGVVYWVRRTNDPPTQPAPIPPRPVDVELQKAFAGASDELEAELDPRTAVMNAYAVLEDVFRSRGEARRAAETASEHLDRVMRPLAIDRSSFVRLGQLYEVARFSTHPVTVSDRAQAAESLQDARRQVETRP